jgi:ubiquinone/menaquinone biosynthesis C-methylase UbiE
MAPCALALIDPAPKETLLEIGFGTGALLSLLAPRIRDGLLAGLDVSELMVRQAQRRLQPFTSLVRLDLRHGSDRDIDWPTGYFSHVAALHSFQFWSEPDATLKAVRKVLQPGGQFTLILRSHARHKPEWLPNPISRSADEIAGTVAVLERAGFDQITRHADTGSSAAITARARTPTR